jgi:hypothetical protein
MGRPSVTMEIRKGRNYVPQLQKALRLLARRQVVVGFPEDKNVERKDDDPLTNAEIAYVMCKGSPANNLPPREFLESGVRDGIDEIRDRMGDAALNGIDGNVEGVDKSLIGVGLVGVNFVRAKINAGPWAPLSEWTLSERRKRGRTGIKPLLDTAQMNNAVNMTVRDRRP